jgi:ubiquinone/menaquinone biosynthesis C-methylase UbiE
MGVDWNQFYKKEHLIYPPSKEMSERERHLWNLVKKLIPSESIQSVLDVGCGAGHITNMFYEYGIHNVNGVDVSPYRVEFASGNYRKCKFAIGSILDLDYPENAFDLVTAMEILEHIEDLGEAVTELKRITNKWLLITVPFEQDIPVVLCPSCLCHFNYDGHLHSFTTSDVVDLLERHGLSIHKIEYYSGWVPSWKKTMSQVKVPQRLILLFQKMLVSAKLTQVPKPLWLGVLASKNRS